MCNQVPAGDIDIEHIDAGTREFSMQARSVGIFLSNILLWNFDSAQYSRRGCNDCLDRVYIVVFLRSLHNGIVILVSAYSFCPRYGLPEGSLVKISCLDTAVTSDIRGAAETVEAAQGQMAADALQIAAEAETMDPASKVRDFYFHQPGYSL
jgi:hypothetical protein